MTTFLTTLVQDLRFTLRQLRRAPGFTFGVIAILALGMGANAGMFTVLEATLFRPLPYTRPANLLQLSVTDSTGKPSLAYLADILAWRERSHTLSDLAYFDVSPAYLIPQGGSDAAQQVLSIAAGSNLFPTLGVTPALGRTFTAEEQQPGKGAVAVLSDAVWRIQFHADPAILGRLIQLDGIPTTVIGVMPSGFLFPADQPRAQIWQPITLTPDALARIVMESPSFSTVARRRPGFSLDNVSTELTSLQREFIPLYSNSADSRIAPAHIQAADYRQTLHAPNQRAGLLALLGAVAVLWLIACANVAGLMLARSAARRRELAVRSALGATRWRIIRQTLVESLLLGVSGAALGLLLSNLTLRLFQHRLTAQLGTKFRGGIGTELHLQPDLRVLLALFFLTLLSVVFFGLLPALLASRKSQVSIEQALRQDGAQIGTARGRHRLQRILIVTELALTLALLVSCGLLLRSVFSLHRVPLGFRTDHVFVISPNLPGYRYTKLDPNTTVYTPLLDRLRSLPGVQSSAITTVAPLDSSFRVTFSLYLGDSDQKSKSFNHSLVTQLRASGPDLQRILGFHMLRGRYFDASDTPESQPVAVVNQAFANLYGASGADVMRFGLGSKERQIRIVGIIDNFHQKGVADSAEPEIDINAAQMRPGDGFYQPTLKAHAQIMLRSDRDPASLLPELRHTLQDFNPDLAAAEIVTMDQIVDDSIGSEILAAHLLETLGGLALLIALAGLYSLLAYLVTLRTREIGLRLALGAKRGQILTLILRSAGGLLLTGCVLGLGLSLLAARLLHGFLFGVAAHDPLTLVLAPALLLAVGSAAAWLPARRAAYLEPLQALRSE